MTEHTPGPWIVEYHENITRAHAEGSHLWTNHWRPEFGRPASVWQAIGEGWTGLPGKIETTEANARLIAAAPDLLEAAEMLDAVLSRGWMSDGSNDLLPGHGALKAAIAKAKGETS